MHMVIRVIVYSENKKEALNKAKGILDNLCGEDKSFDYYTIFDDNKSKVSGPARWGNLHVVAEADSNEGKKLIDDGMKFTKDDFIRNIKKVRETITIFTDEELFEQKLIEDKSKVVNRLIGNMETDLDMVKWYCYCIGQYKGPHVWMYDSGGEGIKDTAHLHNVLTKWKCVYEDKGKENPYKDMKIFIIPSDVHY